VIDSPLVYWLAGSREGESIEGGRLGTVSCAYRGASSVVGSSKRVGCCASKTVIGNYAVAFPVIFMSPQRELGGAQSLGHPPTYVGGSWVTTLVAHENLFVVG